MSEEKNMRDKLSETAKNGFVGGIIASVIIGIFGGFLAIRMLHSIGFFSDNPDLFGTPAIEETDSDDEVEEVDEVDNTSKPQELDYSPTVQKHNDIPKEQEEENSVTLTQLIMEPYMNELQRRIKMNWEPPVEARGKVVKILLKISKDGSLLSSEIQKSSGIPEVDEAALDAVRVSAPFRPLPPECKKDSIEILFTLDYHQV